MARTPEGLTIRESGIVIPKLDDTYKDNYVFVDFFENLLENCEDEITKSDREFTSFEDVVITRSKDKPLLVISKSCEDLEPAAGQTATAISIYAIEEEPAKIGNFKPIVQVVEYINKDENTLLRPSVTFGDQIWQEEQKAGIKSRQEYYKFCRGALVKIIDDYLV